MDIDKLINADTRVKIAKIFNKKAKKGIAAITDEVFKSYQREGEGNELEELEPGASNEGKASEPGAFVQQNEAEIEEIIAQFFIEEKQNLDLKLVGEYLSEPKDKNNGMNAKVLDHFTKNMDFKGKEFDVALRSYLKTFKLPVEAQKIDRLVQKFSEVYVQQNGQVEGKDEAIKTSDAAYTLAFATIMLNNDLHNPTIKKHMTFEEFQKNLRGVNDAADFDQDFLKKTYDNIKAKAFDYNFVKEPPGMEINSSLLKNDPVFNKLNSAKNLKVSELWKLAKITLIFKSIVL
ncbi:MAG: hypothetical protein HRU35_07255 [Rickettsiaceae bacterium]|nr:hypothetical protein [Rickettsiaceae bacterium]